MQINLLRKSSRLRLKSDSHFFYLHPTSQRGDTTNIIFHADIDITILPPDRTPRVSDDPVWAIFALAPANCNYCMTDILRCAFGIIIYAASIEKKSRWAGSSDCNWSAHESALQLNYILLRNAMPFYNFVFAIVNAPF